MQDKILTEMHGVLEKTQVDYDIPLLYMDPAYHGNFGDVFITYGALVLVERLGFKHHTECGIYQSWSKNYPCRQFENFPNGSGLAFFHGGNSRSIYGCYIFEMIKGFRESVILLITP